MTGLNVVIQSVGVVLVVISVAFIIKPEIVRWMIRFITKGKRIYAAGVCRTVLAVVFLMGYKNCKEPRIIAFLGILMLLSAILVFAMGPRRLGPIIGWYERQPAFLLRALCVLLLGLGLVVIYSA